MNRLPDAPLSDEDLGSMLGESITSRVATRPTTAPSFDGVERRARQITRRRRTAAGLAVGALALFGGIGVASLVGDDESSTESDVVTEPDLETDDTVDESPDREDPVVEDPVVEAPTAPIRVTGLIDDQRFIGVTENGTEIDLLTVTGDERITDALVLADGSILAAITDTLLDPTRRIVHLAGAGAEPTVLSENGFLTGGAVIDGVPYAFVGDAVDADDSFEPTALRQVDLSTGSSVDLLEGAFGAEWAISDIDVRGDQLLYVDLSEGGWTWFVTDVAATNRIPLRSGSWADDVWPTAPRFSRTDDGYWWVEQDRRTASWSLVRGSADLTELDRRALDIGTNQTEAALQLEVTDDLMVINIIGDPEEPPLEFTTIWVDPMSLETSLEIEDGIIGFVEPPESG